jgi:hypothetical protein
MKTRFIIPTTKNHFIVWFVSRWHMPISLEYFQNAKTHVFHTLQTPQIHPENSLMAHIHIDATNVYEKEGETTATAYGLKDVIEIHVVEIDNSRITLDIECISELAEKEVLLQFIDEIKTMWVVQDITALGKKVENEPVSETQPIPEGPKLSIKDQQVLEYWNEDYTDEDIGGLLVISAGRVRNIISRLRKQLGEEKVPYHSNRKK